MSRNRNRKGNATSTDDRARTRRKILSVLAGVLVVLTIIAGVMWHSGNLPLFERKQHPAVTTAEPQLTREVTNAEDNSAPTCAAVGSAMFGKNVTFKNKADQPILNDNSTHLAPQYTCIYKKDGTTYVVGTAKEKPLPPKTSKNKTQSDPLFDYVVRKYTYDPNTETGNTKMSSHAYTAVAGYNDNLSASAQNIVRTAKVFIYDNNQVRGGAFKCGNVIVSIAADTGSTIDVMNKMVASALTDPTLKKACGK